MIQPINDRVVIKPFVIEADQNGFVTRESGIIQAVKTMEAPQEGVVIATGPGRPLTHPVYDPHQNCLLWYAPMPVKVGDIVSYSKYGGTEVEIDGEKVLIFGNLDGVIGILSSMDAEEEFHIQNAFAEALANSAAGD